MAQAAFVDLALALAPRYFGVDVDARFLFVRQLNDDKPPQLPDLIRRQPDAPGGAHRIHHIMRERDQPLIDPPRPLGAPPKNRMRYFQNFENGQLRTPFCLRGLAK